MGFWSNLVGGKVEDAGDALTALAFSWDPEAATDAELQTAVDQQEQDVRLRMEFQRELEREQQELKMATRERDDALELLRNIQAEVAGVKEGSAAYKKHMANARAVAAQLTKLNEKVDREAADIPAAQQRFDEINAIVEENQNMINQAYQSRDRAIADLKAAERDKQRAAEDRKRQERLDKARAGSGVSAGLSRLEAAAAKARAEAAVDREMGQRVRQAKGGSATAMEDLKSSYAPKPVETDPFAALSA